MGLLLLLTVTPQRLTGLQRRVEAERERHQHLEDELARQQEEARRGGYAWERERAKLVQVLIASLGFRV